MSASAQSSFGIEYGTGRIICTGDADDTAGSVGDDYAASAAWDRRVFGANLPCGEELTDLDPGVWKQTRPFDGADQAGRSASFRIYVLHDTYSWTSGSAEFIELKGEPVSPATIFAAPNFNARFCSAHASFGMGASSSDGNTVANRQLASARTATITDALKTARATCPEGRIPILFGVNLGEHAERVACADGGDCTPPPADQRRVMIIATEDLALNVDLPQALAAALRDQDVFADFDVGNYQMFDVVSQ
ncbi:MAG: hypothetical protein AAFS13_03170 [Pseudomonadota bacterium]